MQIRQKQKSARPFANYFLRDAMRFLRSLQSLLFRTTMKFQTIKHRKQMRKTKSFSKRLPKILLLLNQNCKERREEWWIIPIRDITSGNFPPTTCNSFQLASRSSAYKIQA